MTAPAIDRDRLAKLLGLLGSDFDGEIAAAGRAADRMIREAGLRWPDVILPSLAGPTPTRSPTVAEALAYVLDRWDLLSDWEIDFAESIQRRRNPLSPKQRQRLDELVAKVRRADARAT